VNAICRSEFVPHSALSGVGPTARAAQEATNLVLLRDVETTVDSLCAGQAVFENFRNAFAECEGAVTKLEVITGVYLDGDDVAIDALNGVVARIEHIIPPLLSKKAAIDRDGALSSDHRERLHDAYEQFIDVLAQVIECAKAARDAIICHDLAAEPRATEQFASVALLKQAMTA
jgi:hypothetical protein